MPLKINPLNLTILPLYQSLVGPSGHCYCYSEKIHYQVGGGGGGLEELISSKFFLFIILFDFLLFCIISQHDGLLILSYLTRLPRRCPCVHVYVWFTMDRSFVPVKFLTQSRTGLDLGFYVIFMLIYNLVDMWFWNVFMLVLLYNIIIKKKRK